MAPDASQLNSTFHWPEMITPDYVVDTSPLFLTLGCKSFLPANPASPGQPDVHCESETDDTTRSNLGTGRLTTSSSRVAKSPKPWPDSFSSPRGL